MSFAPLLGKRVTLYIRRFGTPGAFLAVGEAPSGGTDPAMLLLGPEIPEGAKEGDALEVFVHLDSEGRPLATLRSPKVELGQVAFLTVTARTEFGAFVDWGLAKELLVPHAEQTADLAVGARVAIGLYLDKSGRLAGTMRIREMLGTGGDFRKGEWVEGEAWRTEPEIGLFVIVERAFIGLVPASEPHRLRRGDQARFRVTHVLPDGKIELSLRAPAHEEIGGDAERILQALSRSSPPRIGDRSSPEEIRDAFGLSKKAFKRAVGRLLKERAVAEDESGMLVRAKKK